MEYLCTHTYNQIGLSTINKCTFIEINGQWYHRIYYKAHDLELKTTDNYIIHPTSTKNYICDEFVMGSGICTFDKLEYYTNTEIVQQCILKLYEYYHMLYANQLHSPLLVGKDIVKSFLKTFYITNSEIVSEVNINYTYISILRHLKKSNHSILYTFPKVLTAFLFKPGGVNEITCGVSCKLKKLQQKFTNFDYLPVHEYLCNLTRTNTFSNISVLFPPFTDISSIEL